MSQSMFADSVIIGLLILSILLNILLVYLYSKTKREQSRREQLIDGQIHRFKNDIQALLSMIKFQYIHTGDKTIKGILSDFELQLSQIWAFNFDINNSTKGDIQLEYLIPEVVNRVLVAYDYTHVRKEFNIENIALPIVKASALGRIVNELTTNACKYAFPNKYISYTKDKPTITIKCYRRNGIVYFELSDNGYLWYPLEEGSLNGLGFKNELDSSNKNEIIKKSFGIWLIEIEVAQLRGTHKFSYSTKPMTGGLSFTLEFKG